MKTYIKNLKAHCKCSLSFLVVASYTKKFKSYVRNIFASFVYLKEGTCETRKNVFYFTS